MTQSGNKCWALCVLVLGLLGPSMAAAQAPPTSGGNGFKVGEGRLHPFLDLEARLDTGVGYFPDPATPDPDDLSTDQSSEVVLRVRPGLKLELPSSRVNFNASGQVEYVRYTGLLTSQSTYGSHLEGEANVTAHFNPEGKVGFVLSDQFSRSDQTRNAALGAGVLSIFNELRAGVPFKPGGGAIEVTPELAWGMELFQAIGVATPVGCTGGVCTPEEVDALDYNNLRLGVDAQWRFLPKTALVVDTDLDLRSYFQGTSPDALLLRGLGGLAGLVSPKIAVTAKVGWSYNFASTGGSTLIAQLEGNYLFSPTMSFKGGYYRTLAPVAAYGLLRDDRGYAEARALFGGKLALHGYVAVDFLSFASQEQPRSDTLVTLDVGPEYQIRPWLVGAAGYLLSARSSSLEGAGLNYARHEGYLRLTLVY